MPVFNETIRSNKCFKDLWKILWTKFLNIDNFFSMLLAASNIGKYPESYFASCLLWYHFRILPIDKYIECNWFFSSVSVIVTSEYKISDNNLALMGKESSVVFHYILIFYSL